MGKRIADYTKSKKRISNGRAQVTLRARVPSAVRPAPNNNKKVTAAGKCPKLAPAALVAIKKAPLVAPHHTHVAPVAHTST
jgi:hypothetical protein